MSGTICSSEYGDAMCLPPACEDAFECAISECRDGFRTRSCVNNGAKACNSYNPVVKIPCLKVEEPRQIPAFAWWNVVMVLAMLGAYYVLKKQR